MAVLQLSMPALRYIRPGVRRCVHRRSSVRAATSIE
jgi:hypothetical protein